VAHAIQIDHDLLGVLAQAAHSQLQQAGFHLDRIVRQPVTPRHLVVRQLQAVERRGRGQRDAAKLRVETLHAQGIALIARRRQQRVTAQLFVIIEVFIPQGQAVDALGQQLRHRVIDKPLIALVTKAASQRARQTQAGIELAQEQCSPITGEPAGREIDLHFALTKILKLERRLLTVCRRLGIDSCGG
jgi:hypothetical protein